MCAASASAESATKKFYSTTLVKEELVMITSNTMNDREVLNLQRTERERWIDRETGREFYSGCVGGVSEEGELPT